MSNTAAIFKLMTRLEFFEFNFNRQARGTYNGNLVTFHRGGLSYKGTDGKLQFNNRNGGDHVVVKVFSDTDRN